MALRTVFYTLLFLGFSNVVEAQQLQEIISKPLDQVMLEFVKTFASSKVQHAKLVGLGDLGTFAKESKKLNACLATYLISKKGFRNIILKVDDWTLRPINILLKSPSALKPGELDSVIKALFRTDFQFRNTEFKSLLEWIKNYNVDHPGDLVNIYGAGADTKIPPAYFLTYMYRVDPAGARKLSIKWSEEAVPDSLTYAEIEKWIKMAKLSKSTPGTKKTIDSCESDLFHNNYVMTYSSIGQKIPSAIIERRTGYIAHQMLSKLAKKSIFYASNTEVVRSLLEAPLVENKRIQSIGKLLGDNLKESYYVIVADFRHKANLTVINPANNMAKTVTFDGPEGIRQLDKQKYYFETGMEKYLVPGYIPSMIQPFEGMDARVIPLERSLVADGIMVLSDVSGIDFSY